MRKIIDKKIDHTSEGVDIKGGINAVIVANVNEKGSSTHVSSKQRIVQRAGNKSRKAGTTTSEQHSDG